MVVRVDRRVATREVPKMMGWLPMPEISTGRHILTCYLRQSVERRRINVTGLNCTTFLKASYHQSPEHIQIPLHIRGDGVGRFTQMKTRSLAGFVKMGGKRLRQQPLA